jgi:hypothetical protein
MQPDTRIVRVPSDLIGGLLDSGTASTYAIHLAALKLDHGSNWVLNEHQIAKPVDQGGVAMGERKFRKGLTLMKKRSVLDRRKGGR